MRVNHKITWIIAFIIIILVNTAGAEFQWVNNITVREDGMTWGYTETFSGMDSVRYRIDIDRNIGNNDSFINAWELLLADKKVRENFKKSIEHETDVRIDNSSQGIKVTGIDSVLSTETIGKTMLVDKIVNRYNVTYVFSTSIMNATSIWFLGETETPVTIVMPSGIDVVDIGGMNNITKNITDHTEITGTISGKQERRGEVTINFTRNESFTIIPLNETNLSTNITEKKPAKTFIERLYETLLGIKSN